MEKVQQTKLLKEYLNHPLISKSALYADMNFPCRKYMEDGKLPVFNTIIINTIYLKWNKKDGLFLRRMICQKMRHFLWF